MSMFRKILILIIIIIFSYILYRLMETRRTLLSMTNDDIYKEGFSLFSTPASELRNMKITDVGPGISSFNTANSNLPLREYIIKSSYNTAFSGSFMNLDTIRYVLSRGCRFVDFEVYMIDGAPCVGCTTDPTYTNVTSQNSILLNDALKQVSFFGFASPTPNMNDPLFVQLRLHTKNNDNTDNTDIYKLVAMTIANTLQNKLYSGPVTGDTIIGDLMGKIVLIIDKVSAPDYKSYPICDNTTTPCYNLANYVNMESGGDVLRSYTYSNLLDQLTTPPYIHDDGKTSSVKMTRMSVPEQLIYSGNPAYSDFISKYGVQFLANRFYVKDTNLSLYEEFFSDNLSAIVPFNVALPYISKHVINS